MQTITQKNTIRFIHCCLWAAGLAYLLLISIVIISGSPAQGNSAFARSIVAWQRPGYFATYDFRHYVTGCLLFSLIPPGLFWFSIRYPARIVWLRKKRSLLLRIGLFASLVLIAIIVFLGIEHKEQILTLLYKKPRGIQLREDGVWAALIIVLWGVVWLILRRNYTLPKIRFPRLAQEIPFWMQGTFLALGVFLVFNPRYAFSFSSLAQYGGEANYQFHHVVSYIGPINDVLHGKTLLVNTTAQYGYGATYLPAVLFWFIGLSFAGFNGYVVAISCGYVIGVYLFLLLATGRWYWALAGTLLYIKLSFFRSVLPSELYIFPSITPLRHWVDIPVLISILWHQRQPTARSRIVLTSSLVVLAVFYNIEIGISLTAAYLVMIVGEGIFSSRWRIVGWQSSSLIVSAAVTSSLVALGTYLHSGDWPDLGRLFYYVFYFGRGYFDTPMPLLGAYYIPLSIYFVTYAVIMYRWYTKSQREMGLFVFLLVYGLCSFVYYLGFSEPNHLFAIIHPSLFLAVLLAQEFLPHLHVLSRLPISSRSILITYGLVLLCFFLWRPLQLAQDLHDKIASRYFPFTTTYHYWPYPGAHIYLTDDDGTAFREAVRAIQTYDPGREAFILSRYDTLLMVMAGKTSPLPYSYLEYGIIYEKDMQSTMKGLRAHPPRYVFLSRAPYTKTVTDNISRIWQRISPLYTYVKPAGAVDVYRRIDGESF